MNTLYKTLGQKAFFAFDAETAHGISITALKLGAGHLFQPFRDKRLIQNFAGLAFQSPVGLAAGYDKNADVPNQVLKLGFGFMEVGTVTPFAQAGNPRPRIFRLPKDGAVINRLSFNNEGHQAALAKLEKASAVGGKKGAIIGVNIGANKDSDDRAEDYVKGIERFYHVAKYFTVNISSPNTPGLRDLQSKEILADLLKRSTTKRHEMHQKTGHKVPLFLKVAPDLTEEGLDDICEEILAHPIDGVIVSNTTVTRPALKEKAIALEMGGLSGKPVRHLSNIVLAKMRTRLGPDFLMIGVGGIDDAQSAGEKIQAGADLMQLYTGFIYQGPTLASDIAKGLVEICEREGLDHIRHLRDQKLQYFAQMPIPAP